MEMIMDTPKGTVADFETGRRTRLKVDKYGTLTWACACGCKRFKVISQPNNIKLVCSKCGNMDIIAWYKSANDSSAGRIFNMNTQTWEK